MEARRMVTRLAAALLAAGQLAGAASNGTPVEAESGLSGEQTEEKVRVFQGANGLAVDGVVGPQTWTALVDADKSVASGRGRHGATTSARGMTLQRSAAARERSPVQYLASPSIRSSTNASRSTPSATSALGGRPVLPNRSQTVLPAV
jgi:hypothetical protein